MNSSDDCITISDDDEDEIFIVEHFVNIDKQPVCIDLTEETFSSQQQQAQQQTRPQSPSSQQPQYQQSFNFSEYFPKPPEDQTCSTPPQTQYVPSEQDRNQPPFSQQTQYHPQPPPPPPPQSHATNHATSHKEYSAEQSPLWQPPSKKATPPPASPLSQKQQQNTQPQSRKQDPPPPPPPSPPQTQTCPSQERQSQSQEPQAAGPPPMPPTKQTPVASTTEIATPTTITMTQTTASTLPNPQTPQEPPKPKKPQLSDGELMLELKRLGNEKYKQNLFDDAIRLYKRGNELAKKLENRDLSAILHFNLAMTYFKVGSFDQAADECARAVKINDNYLKAHLKRAEIYQRQGKFEEAVICYEHICELDNSNYDYKKLLEQAKEAAKKIKKRNYYELLGLNFNLTREDLKKAYRREALSHHPDRHSDADIVTRRIEEKRFKEASEANTYIQNKMGYNGL